MASWLLATQYRLRCPPTREEAGVQLLRCFCWSSRSLYTLQVPCLLIDFDWLINWLWEKQMFEWWNLQGMFSFVWRQPQKDFPHPVLQHQSLCHFHPDWIQSTPPRIRYCESLISLRNRKINAVEIHINIKKNQNLYLQKNQLILQYKYHLFQRPRLMEKVLLQLVMPNLIIQPIR